MTVTHSSLVGHRSHETQPMIVAGLTLLATIVSVWDLLLLVLVSH